MRFEDYQRLDRADAQRRLKAAYDRILVHKRPVDEWDGDAAMQYQLHPNNGQFQNGDAMWAYWEDHAKDHLPLALKIIERDDLDYGLLAKHTCANPNENIELGQKVVLFVAGYSPEQLALSIAVHILNGCRVFVPVSGRAWTTVEETVCRHLREHLFFGKADEFTFLDVQPINEDRAEHPAETFATISNWIRKHRDKLLAIDCTGGQKPMDAGAIQAASYWDVPAYYIHFKDYDFINRRPKPHSCQYKKMGVPESSFSLPMRKQIRTRFMSRDFATARSLIVPLYSELEHAVGQADDAAAMRAQLGDDLKAFCDARDLIERSHGWAHLRYNEPILADHSPELHRFFRKLVDEQRDSAPAKDHERRGRKAFHRVLMETLLGAGHRLELLYYVVDEYWRLCEMLHIDQVRDVQIGVVGLIELIMDSLLVIAWRDDTKVARITGAHFSECKRENGPSDEASLAIASTKLLDASFPSACFPLGNQEAKRSLLKDGNCRIHLCVLADDDGTPNLKKYEADEHQNSPHWDLQITLSTSRPYLVTRHSKKSKASLWRTFWGAYPSNYKEGGWNINWVQFRHDIAHMRAPFFDERHREFLRTHMLGTFLPHFIELVYLANGFHHSSPEQRPSQLHFIREGQPPPELLDPRAEVHVLGRVWDDPTREPHWELEWLRCKRLSRQSRVPWLSPTNNIDEWLTLPPDPTE